MVLPLFGPSDVRDSVGLALEYFADPRYFVRNRYVTWPLWALGLVRTRAELLSLDATIDSAYDPYSLVRNAYLQHRDFKVNGGQGTEEQDAQEQKLFDEAAQDTDAPAPPAKPEGSAPPPSRPRRRVAAALDAAQQQLLDVADARECDQALRQGEELQRAAGKLGRREPVEHHRQARAVSRADPSQSISSRCGAAAASSTCKPCQARQARTREGQGSGSREAAVRRRGQAEGRSAAGALTWSACRSIRASPPTPGA